MPYNQLIKTGVHRMVPNLQGLEPQPRFGFAWQVMPNTVVRGGFGIFYDNYPGALLDGLSENPPNDPTFVVAGSNLSYASDPTSLFASAANSNAGFQGGFNTGGSFNSIAATTPGFSAPNLAATITNPSIMRVYKWSLDLQRQFGANTAIDLAYIGNHGADIYFQNQGINGCNNLATPADNTTLPPTPAAPGFVSLPPCNATTGLGINPNFLTVSYATNNAISNYHGFTASFTHRYASGLVQVNYSWSHALDDVSNSGVPGLEFSNTNFGATNSSITFPEDPANLKKFNYGSADYDVRHSLNLNYVWELPIKKLHGPSRLVNGWFVNGAMYLRPGFPLTLIDNTTSTALQGGGYGDSSDAVDVFGNVVSPGGAGQNCRTLFGSGQPSRNNCLNAANFAGSGYTPSIPGVAGTPGTFGNVARNTFRGPGYWNTDFALMKHTKITERVEFVFGAQFFNVFNHSNFDSPVMDISSSHFGQILKTTTPPTTMYGSVLGADAAPRLIQLKTQLNF
jgi:hypothetical protein